MSGLVVTTVGNRPTFWRDRIDSLASRPRVVLSMLSVSVRSMTIAEKFNAVKIFSIVASSAETLGQAHFTDEFQDEGTALLGELDSTGTH